MATTLSRRPALSAERWFFLSVAACLTLASVVGFGPTWYWAPLVGGKPLPAIVHLHGAMATLWLLLFATQVGLVVGNRRDLHRALGKAGALVALVSIGTALLVSMAAFNHPRAVAAALPPATLLFIQLVTIFSFVAFVLLGLSTTRDSGAHKRYMLLASITIAMPALARIARQADTYPLPPNGFGGMILADGFFAALVAYDLMSRKRLHPVTLWAGGVFLVAQPLRYFVGISDWWLSTAATLFSQPSTIVVGA